MVRLVISGEAGGTWLLVREEKKWNLYQQEQPVSPDTTITMEQEVAWRLFTKGISRDEAEKSISFADDRSLGLPVLEAVSIIA